MLACVCGGVGELAIFALATGAIGSAWVWLRHLVHRHGRK